LRGQALLCLTVQHKDTGFADKESDNVARWEPTLTNENRIQKEHLENFEEKINFSIPNCLSVIDSKMFFYTM
jgi:hypothetical protein